MSFVEFVSTLRPFEVFAECLVHECDMEIALQAVGDESLEEYFCSQENWSLYYREIEKRNLLTEYQAYKEFVGKWGLYGTE